MSDVVHKGQKQVVEGSAVGEFHVTTKLSYDSVTDLVEYIGEAKIGIVDRQNAHYIHKFIYDVNFNILRIMIALNETNCNCTNINLTIINENRVTIEALAGDFVECNVDDGITLITPTQALDGKIAKKESNTVVVVELNAADPTLINEVGTVIALGKLLVKLENNKTKNYTKRRWDRRAQYTYGTSDAE